MHTRRLGFVSWGQVCLVQQKPAFRGYPSHATPATWMTLRKTAEASGGECRLAALAKRQACSILQGRLLIC